VSEVVDTAGAAVHHPTPGGSVTTGQPVGAAYDELVEILAARLP
jgi:hypothetical protein